MTSKMLTTFEQREIIQAHNSIFLNAFMRNRYSVAYPITSNNNEEWIYNYELKLKPKEVEGV